MYARDTLSSADPSLAVSVQPTTSFSIPEILNSATPISSLTPKMNRVRSVASSAGVIIFTEPLNFLDT